MLSGRGGIGVDSAECPLARFCRTKTGYHMRKHFGAPQDAPSRAESFAGYDDSYHTQDTRGSTLPIAFMGGGGAAMGAGGSVQGTMHAAGRSNAASVMTYFQEGSMRAGTAAGRSGSHGVRAACMSATSCARMLCAASTVHHCRCLPPSPDIHSHTPT